MPELSQDQARALADNFLAVSEVVDDYRTAHFSDLSPDQRTALRRLQQQLSDQSIHFTAVAIQLTLEDLEPTLERIRGVTHQVNEAVAHLEDVHRVINVASGFLSLGTAIASGNPGAIASAISDTIGAIQGA